MRNSAHSAEHESADLGHKFCIPLSDFQINLFIFEAHGCKMGMAEPERGPRDSPGGIFSGPAHMTLGALRHKTEI